MERSSSYNVLALQEHWVAFNNKFAAVRKFLFYFILTTAAKNIKFLYERRL